MGRRGEQPYVSGVSAPQGMSTGKGWGKRQRKAASDALSSQAKEAAGAPALEVWSHVCLESTAKAPGFSEAEVSCLLSKVLRMVSKMPGTAGLPRPGISLPSLSHSRRAQTLCAPWADPDCLCQHLFGSAALPFLRL